LEKKKSSAPKKSRVSSAKDAALRVGKSLEDTFIRKDDAANNKQGMDQSMNSANFAIFQGAGLETLDSRGLGRTWTRRDENVDRD
jgi:hypothetical protein